MPAPMLTQETMSGRTPLHRAAIEAIDISQTDLVRTFISAGADIRALDDNGASTLHYAARRPDSPGLHWHSEEERKRQHRAFSKHEAVSLLLEAGAAIDASDKSGTTPLHLAALLADVQSVNVLIGKGADIHAKDSAGICVYSPSAGSSV